jgi:hypothetical protein
MKSRRRWRITVRSPPKVLAVGASAEFAGLVILGLATRGAVVRGSMMRDCYVQRASAGVIVTDAHGGPVENRAGLMLETTQAMSADWSADRGPKGYTDYPVRDTAVAAGSPPRNR